MKQTIPNKEECFQLMKKHNMLENIFDHSIQVMNVSLVIYNHLQGPQIISRDIIIAAALLHDISKTQAIQENKKRHDMMGGQLLRDLGYDILADIVESHVNLNNFNYNGPLEEREIIFYADKRVMHDQVVTIDERFNDLIIRYGKSTDAITMIEGNRDFSLQLEKKVDRFLTEPVDKLFQ